MARRRRIFPVNGSVSITAGSTNRIYVASDSTVSPGAGSFTVAFEAKTVTMSAQAGLMQLCNAAGSWTTGLSLLTTTGSGVFSIRMINGSATTTIPLSADWRRIAIAVDAVAKQITIFVNGAQAWQSSTNFWTGSIAAGACFGFGDVSFELGALRGYVQDVVLDIGHAWSASDAAADCFDAAPPSTYTHRWYFNEGAGTTANAVRGGVALVAQNAIAFSAETASAKLGRGIVRNGCPWSEKLDASTWSPTNAPTPTLWNGTPPSGVGAMYVLSDNTANGLHIVATSIPFANGETVMVSAYVVAVANTTYCQVSLNSGSSAAEFALTGDGSVASATGGPAGIQNVGGGVYRIWFTGKNYGAAVLYVANALGSVSYAGASGAPCQLAYGGIQVERPAPGQTTPSSYVPTQNAPLSVYGKRDPRQNWLKSASDVSKSSAWSPTGLAGITTDGTTTPYGLTMRKLVESTANSTHLVAQTPSTNIPSTALRTMFVDLKADGRTYAALFTDNGNQGAMFDLVGGTVTATAFSAGQGANARLRSLGNGVWRCIITCTASVTGAASHVVYASSGPAFGALTYAGDGVSGIYVGRNAMAQTDQEPDFVDTTTAPANSNGAPRKAAA